MPVLPENKAYCSVNLCLQPSSYFRFNLHVYSVRKTVVFKIVKTFEKGAQK